MSWTNSIVKRADSSGGTSLKDYTMQWAQDQAPAKSGVTSYGLLRGGAAGVKRDQGTVGSSADLRWPRALCHLLIEQLSADALSELIPILKELLETSTKPARPPELIRSRVARVSPLVAARRISFPDEE